MNIGNLESKEETKKSKTQLFFENLPSYTHIGFKWITSIFLPFFAIIILGYEVYDVVGHVRRNHGTIDPKHIFMALILSTTAVAFMGMHRAVHKLIPEKEGENDKVKGHIPFFFTLIANAILLAGLIVVYDKYFPNPDKENLNDKKYHAPCCNKKLHANKH